MGAGLGLTLVDQYTQLCVCACSHACIHTQMVILCSLYLPVLLGQNRACIMLILLLQICDLN